MSSLFIRKVWQKTSGMDSDGGDWVEFYAFPHFDFTIVPHIRGGIVQIENVLNEMGLAGDITMSHNGETASFNAQSYR